MMADCSRQPAGEGEGACLAGAELSAAGSGDCWQTEVFSYVV